MKRIVLLCIVMVLFSSCAREIPDLTAAIESERPVFEENLEVLVDSTEEITSVEPENWEGKTLYWMVMEAPLIPRNLPMDLINKHLEEEGVDYRIGLTMYHADVNEETFGRQYTEAIKKAISNDIAHVINVGYRHESPVDELSIEILKNEDLLQKFSPSEFLYGVELQDEGSIYGQGNPSYRGYQGFFVLDEDLELEMTSPLTTLRSLEEKNATLYIGSSPVNLLSSYYVENFFTLEEDNLVFFWETAEYKELANEIENLWNKGLILEDLVQTKVLLTSGYPHEKTNFLTAEEGVFFPMTLSSSPSNYYVSTENVLLADTELKDEGLDFLKRLDRDRNLQRILAGNKEEYLEEELPYMPTRLFNETGLFPEVEEALKNRSSLEVGLYIDREEMLEIRYIKETLDSNTLELLEYMKPGWEEEAKKASESLREEHHDLLMEIKENILAIMKGVEY